MSKLIHLRSQLAIILQHDDEEIDLHLLNSEFLIGRKLLYIVNQKRPFSGAKRYIGYWMQF